MAREERGLFYASTQIFLELEFAPFIAYWTDLLSACVFENNGMALYLFIDHPVNLFRIEFTLIASEEKRRKWENIQEFEAYSLSFSEQQSRNALREGETRVTD